MLCQVDVGLWLQPIDEIRYVSIFLSWDCQNVSIAGSRRRSISSLNRSGVTTLGVMRGIARGSGSASRPASPGCLAPVPGAGPGGALWLAGALLPVGGALLLAGGALLPAGGALLPAGGALLPAGGA